MKYPIASHFVLLATIATSTIHRGIAVPCPGLASPAIHQRRKSNDVSESSSTELHVDNEGILYSSSTTSTSTSTSKMATAPTRRRSFNQLRGGEIFVDNEGNLYTPRKVLPSSAKKAAPAPAPSQDVPSPTEALRGGSKNHDIGGLSVDPEGNFYATATPSCAGAGALFSLRGGSLCVDKEGNFYSSRNPEVQQGPVVHRRRRSTGISAGPVLLAKNRLPKKKPKKPSASNSSNPMAFIGYNNALMET